MSDLLNSASLVMIPSGYKEDVVYSQIPTDGSGDLSFSRASNGTRINSAGLVEVVAWNLLQYSEDLSNAVWGNDAGNTKISNTTTAPNGTVTADTISAISGNVMNVYQIITTNDGTLSYSVYLKKNATNLISIYIYQTFGSTGFKALGEINFDNGTFTPSIGTGTIESVGNGWFRVSVTANLLSGANSFGIYTTSDTGTRNVYIWGAQLNIGATAKPYFPTTDRLNVPRLTYQNGGGGCPSLLLEKQSTNLATQSTVSSFGSGTNDWLNGANSPASINQTTGIDGTQNGTKYTKTAGETTNDFFYKNQVPVTSGTTYTVSGYIKLGTAANAVVVINNTSAWNSVPNGSIVCSTANGFSTTAWKRFELTITGPSTNQINIHYGYHNETGVTAQADGTFFLDGFQVEASSYATSLIPTTSSSATRVADACYKTGISSLIGQTEGTFFLEVKNWQFALDTVMIGLSDGSLSNYLQISTNGSSGDLQSVIFTGGSPNVLGSTTPTIGQNLKIAVGYKVNDYVIYVNGTQIGTLTSQAAPSSLTRVDIGSLDWLSSTLQPRTPISQAVLFKTRLTNAELASLTS